MKEEPPDAEIDPVGHMAWVVRAFGLDTILEASRWDDRIQVVDENGQRVGGATAAAVPIKVVTRYPQPQQESQTTAPQMNAVQVPQRVSLPVPNCTPNAPIASTPRVADAGRPRWVRLSDSQPGNSGGRAETDYSPLER